MQALTKTGPFDIEFMERLYDADGASDQGTLQTGVFSELAASLRQQSVLLALEGSVTKEKIYSAYTHDLELLQRYQEEFNTCIQAAVRCSIIVNAKNARQERKHWKETWELLKTQIPSAVTALLIDFSFTRASLPTPELLAEMKKEFCHGIEQILQPFADWLRVLVTNQFIGLVEWGDLDVCRYHYFKHEVTKKIVNEKIRNETSFNASMPYGSRTEYRVVRDREIHQRQLRERHVHHIIRAKLHKLEEYPHRVPKNVADFIDAIPVSLQPHVHIVEGVITKEEVLRHQVGEERIVSSEILSVWKASPGVLLGYFNMIGWSGDDLKSRGVFYRHQQIARTQARKQKAAARRRHLIGHLFTT